MILYLLAKFIHLYDLKGLLDTFKPNYFALGIQYTDVAVALSIFVLV